MLRQPWHQDLEENPEYPRSTHLAHPYSSQIKLLLLDGGCLCHYDIKLKVSMNRNEFDVFVAVRPGTHDFLNEMSKYYELVIFTASLSKYADPLMDILDEKGLCTARLYREHCRIEGRIFPKDMTQLGRRLEDIILVDNSPNSYKL